MVECLPSVNKVLASIPSTTRQNNKTPHSLEHPFLEGVESKQKGTSVVCRADALKRACWPEKVKWRPAL